MTKTNQIPANATDAVKQMHKFVCKLAHKAVKTNKKDFDDVYQYGMMGVVRAYNDYDPAKSKAQFKTVAYKYAYQHIMDNYQRKQYDYYKNTSIVPVDDFQMTTTNTGLDEKITFEQLLKGLDTTTKIITLMRNAGHGYQHIVETLNKTTEHRDKPLTYAQVRNKHINMMEEIAL